MTTARTRTARTRTARTRTAQTKGAKPEESVGLLKSRRHREERHQILAVVIRQYRTGLYRSCVSLGRGNLVTMGTHEDERSAEESLDLFWKAYDEGTIGHTDDLLRLIAPSVFPAEGAFPSGKEGRGVGCAPGPGSAIL